MRLDPKAIEIITSQTKSVVGENIAFWLFGSRVDDQLKGGNIDLLIEVEHKLDNRISIACQINAKIQMALGSQRLDAIVKDLDSANLPIHEMAKKWDQIVLSENKLLKLQALANIVFKDAKHLEQIAGRLFAENDWAWVKRLDQDIDLAERVEAFVGRFGRLQDTF